LPLRIVEVRRHGDDGFGHLLAQEFCGIIHQLTQHLRRHLFGRDVFAVDGEAHGVTGSFHNGERHDLDF
jgi:hypothetical protein